MNKPHCTVYMSGQHLVHTPKMIFFFIVIFCNIFSQILSNEIEGVTQLDELSFDKMVSQFEHVIVKFDLSNPEYWAHKAYEELTQQVTNSNIDNLLLAEVRVRDYASKKIKGAMNLAYRFSVDTTKENLPEFLIFSYGKEVARFKGEKKSLAELRQFLISNTGVWIEKPGSVRELDFLAGEFIREDDEEGRRWVLEDAEDVAKEDDEDAQEYIKLMKGALQEGEPEIEREELRIKGLLRGKISKKNKEKFQKRINIIESFKRDNWKALPKIDRRNLNKAVNDM